MNDLAPRIVRYGDLFEWAGATAFVHLAGPRDPAGAA